MGTFVGRGIDGVGRLGSAGRADAVGRQMLWAYYDATAYGECSAANSQELEDALLSAADPYSVFTAVEACPVLGDGSVYRAHWSLWNNLDNNKTGINGSQRSLSPVGQGQSFFKPDAGAPNVAHNHPDPPTCLGDLRLVQVVETAAASVATWRVQVDGGVKTAIGTYDRSTALRYDHYSPAGSVRGPIPTTFSPLGWVYWHISVAADCNASTDQIWLDYDAGLDQLQKYRAVLARLVADGYEDDIIFAQAFHPGSVADYGDDVTLTNVIYTPAGVSP